MPQGTCSRRPGRHAHPEQDLRTLPVTTPPDTAGGVPLLPPLGEPSPSDIAQALRDPVLIKATEVPFLPPAAPPRPAIAAPPVFDAKAMVDSTKRTKIDNPSYGSMPTGTPESRAAADALRAKMRRKRRRNKMFGWAMAIVFVVVVGGTGFAVYTMYKDDQEANSSRRERRVTADADAATGDQPAALTPLGEQEQVIGAMNALDSDATPSAGGLVGAADAAQNAVNQLNNANASVTSQPTLAVSDVLPFKIAAVATELQPLDGFTRYTVAVDDAIRADPLGTPGWLDRLEKLPQASADSLGSRELPAVGSGEIAIALQTSGDRVTRLVVVSADPAIYVDL